MLGKQGVVDVQSIKCWAKLGQDQLKRVSGDPNLFTSIDNARRRELGLKGQLQTHNNDACLQKGRTQQRK